MMNITTKPPRSGNPYRRTANSKRIRHLKFNVATTSILLALMSGQVLAAPNCSAYIPAINKQLASYLANGTLPKDAS